MIPVEIVDHILSFIDNDDTYSLNEVCPLWKQLLAKKRYRDAREKLSSVIRPTVCCVERVGVIDLHFISVDNTEFIFSNWSSFGSLIHQFIKRFNKGKKRMFLDLSCNKTPFVCVGLHSFPHDMEISSLIAYIMGAVCFATSQERTYKLEKINIGLF